MKALILTVTVWLMAVVVNAQISVDLQNVSKLKPVNRTVQPVVENGRQVLSINEASGQGLAILNDITFSSGTIEFDVKGRNVMQRSFVGVAFHVQDDSHFDAIYFRPSPTHSAIFPFVVSVRRLTFRLAVVD